MHRLLAVVAGLAVATASLAAVPTEKQELDLQAAGVQGELDAIFAGEAPGADAQRARARAACQHLDTSLAAFDSDPLHRAWSAKCWGAVKFFSGDKTGGCAAWRDARRLAQSSSREDAADVVETANQYLEQCPAA